MNVSCFLKNNESLLIENTDETTYENVKDTCSRRRCTYDFVINKFNLSENDHLSTYFIDCNFIEIVGIYKDNSNNNYFFIIEYSSVKNEKLIRLFPISITSTGEKIDDLLSKYGKINPSELIGVNGGEYGVKRIDDENEIINIEMSKYIPPGSSHLVFTSLSKGTKKRETIKVVYYYDNPVKTDDMNKVNTLLQGDDVLKIIRSTPRNKQITSDYLEEEKEIIVNAISIHSQQDFNLKLNDLSVGGRDEET